MKPRRRIVFLSHPGAGKGTPRAGLGRVIGGILSSQHRVYEPTTLAELDKVAERIHDERPDIIAIAGGDGTLHQSLTRVLRRYLDSQDRVPSVLLLPTGTMNMVATAIGAYRHHAMNLATRVLTKIQDDRPFDVAHVHAIKVNDEYAFLYGAGLPVNFLRAYYAEGKKRGGHGAARVIFGSALREAMRKLRFSRRDSGLMTPVHAKVTYPEGSDPPVAPFMTHTALMAASIDQLAFGCRAFPDAMSVPGCFMVRSTRLGFWGLAASLGQLWAGLPLPNSHDVTIRRAIVEYERPTEIQLDGDLKEPRERDVLECGPSLTFITG